MAMQDERAGSGRRSRVVLTPRRWRQAPGSWERRWQESPVTGESAEETVKTIARGMPAVSGVTCMLVCALNVILHTRPRDASGARHSLRPLSERAGRSEQNSREIRGEIARLCLLLLEK
jgi:hypothetical protein